MLRTLADEQVVGPLVSALRRRGVDVATVVELGLKAQDDEVLAAVARHTARVILTSDPDFLALAARYAARGEAMAPIIFWPQQRRTVGELLARIMSILSQADSAAVGSRVFFV
ncbi:MAG: DUF5615 family PIN-like protein [Planctomycetaceae bacterium]